MSGMVTVLSPTWDNDPHPSCSPPGHIIHSQDFLGSIVAQKIKLKFHKTSHLAVEWPGVCKIALKLQVWFGELQFCCVEEWFDVVDCCEWEWLESRSNLGSNYHQPVSPNLTATLRSSSSWRWQLWQQLPQLVHPAVIPSQSVSHFVTASTRFYSDLDQWLGKFSAQMKHKIILILGNLRKNVIKVDFFSKHNLINIFKRQPFSSEMLLIYLF